VIWPVVSHDPRGKKATETVGFSAQRLSHDPRALTLSENIIRRHMTAGQRAMATAMIYPEGTPGKKSKTSLASKEVGFSAARLSQARTVLRYSQPIAEAVCQLTGSCR
jgi:hypothetical protein